MNKRERLADIRARHVGAPSEVPTLTLDDVRFLIDLAAYDYDMSADEVASNVYQLVVGDSYEHMLTHLPGGPPSTPPPARRIRRPGPMTIVDTFMCEHNNDIMVMVSHGRDALGEIQCPVCERTMTRINRKLRNGAPPSRPEFKWSQSALRTNQVRNGQ